MSKKTLAIALAQRAIVIAAVTTAAVIIVKHLESKIENSDNS